MVYHLLAWHRPVAVMRTAAMLFCRNLSVERGGRVSYQCVFGAQSYSVLSHVCMWMQKLLLLSLCEMCGPHPCVADCIFMSATGCCSQEYFSSCSWDMEQSPVCQLIESSHSMTMLDMEHITASTWTGPSAQYFCANHDVSLNRSQLPARGLWPSTLCLQASLKFPPCLFAPQCDPGTTFTILNILLHTLTFPLLVMPSSLWPLYPGG